MSRQPSQPDSSQPTPSSNFDETAREEQAIASASGAVPLDDLDVLDDLWDDPVEQPVAPARPQARPSAPSTPPSASTSASASEKATDLIANVRSTLEELMDKARPLIDKGLVAIDKARLALKQLQDKAGVVLEKARPALQQLQAKARPALRQLQTRWQAALAKLRTVLPASLNQALSDRALTGTIIGIFVVLLWFSTGLSSGKSPQPSQAAQPQPSPVAPPAQIAAPTVDIPIASPFPDPAATVASPPPTLDLPPEQRLIAAIQEQVAEVTDRYTNGLIQATQANFRSSRLIVKVGSEWYGLSQTRQDTLGNEMLKRARELDFNKLEITDTDGRLLARSPVVGDEMVILKRSQDESVTPSTSASDSV